MIRIVVFLFVLTSFFDLFAQKTNSIFSKNMIVCKENLPTIGFKYYLPVTHQEAINRSVVPTFNQKFNTEITKIDSNSLSVHRIQNIYYRMKMWYAFQFKNKNGLLFKKSETLLAKI